MILKGSASVWQLQQISIFRDLDPLQIKSLLAFSYWREYQSSEIIMNEGEQVAESLYCLITGLLEIKKVSVNTGKESIIRLISAGEIFAASAIFGNGIAPATVLSITQSQVLTIDREALLNVIAQNPEISLKILAVYNQRLQELHNTVHSLITEKAIIRLVNLIRYYQDIYGVRSLKEGNLLNVSLTYDQIANSIGISYEECARLFKQLKGVVSYRRGGKILIQDWTKLTNL